MRNGLNYRAKSALGKFFWHLVNFYLCMFFLLYLTQVEIMIPIVEQVEEIMEDCTYNNLSAEEWANQAEELEKELNLYKYMARM